MFIVFDCKIKPKKNAGIEYKLSMDIEDMLLYSNVMHYYIKGVYNGDKLSNVVFDSFWNKIREKFNAIDNPDVAAYKKILTGITSVYEFMQNGFSDGISFINQLCNPKCNKPLSKDKHDIFKFLWDQTDEMLFDMPIVDSIIMIMLVFVKILIIQSIEDANDRQTMTANWTGSYIINYVCNNDIKFNDFCINLFPSDLGIKNILKKHKIPILINREKHDSDMVCQWTNFRYLNRPLVRNDVSERIDSTLRSRLNHIDTRHKIIFEMWCVTRAVFGQNVDPDVYSELEIVKMQTIISENNAIDVLRRVRNKLRSNKIIAVTENNISSFMDMDLYNLTLKIATDMCANVGKDKNKKYIKI